MLLCTVCEIFPQPQIWRYFPIFSSRNFVLPFTFRAVTQLAVLFCNSWWKGPYHKKANSRLDRGVDIKWSKEETQVRIGLWILKAAFLIMACNFFLLDLSIPKSIIINQILVIPVLGQLRGGSAPHLGGWVGFRTESWCQHSLKEGNSTEHTDQEQRLAFSAFR